MNEHGLDRSYIHETWSEGELVDVRFIYICRCGKRYQSGFALMEHCLSSTHARVSRNSPARQE